MPTNPSGDFNVKKYTAKGGSAYLKEYVIKTKLALQNLQKKLPDDQKFGIEMGKIDASCSQRHANYYGLKDTYTELMEHYRQIMVQYNTIVNMHNQLEDKCGNKIH